MNRLAVRWVKRAGLVSLGAYAVFTVGFNWISSTPLRVDPLTRRSGQPVVDVHAEIARKYAPQIYHEIDRGARTPGPSRPSRLRRQPRRRRQLGKLPALRARSDRSYAHLETATHRFLTYHIFHPRDWEPFELPGLHLTHEGDGENLQVVVEKAGGHVVLLFTQAHYRGKVYAFPGAPGASEAPLWLVGEDGRIGSSGTHAAVFVEARGHGIYGLGDEHARIRLDGSGGARFERHGLVLRPGAQGEPIREPRLDEPDPVPYQLESTIAKVWPGVKSGELLGPGRLLDGLTRYEDARVSLAIPKFHRGNRFSGPFGPSRGISPFAVDFGWSHGTLGSLFFDPARRYAEVLGATGWAREYVDYPFNTR